MNRSKTTEKHERDIGDESADPRDRRRAIMAVTFDRRYEYEPLIRELIDHPDGIVRAEAIGRLLFIWDRTDLLDRAIEMALNDPDHYVRSSTVGALELFGGRHTDDDLIRRRIVAALVRSLRQEPDWADQVGAHRGILRLLDGNEDYAPDHFERETDVDWKRLREYEPE